jgi:hypothetical protein
MTAMHASDSPDTAVWNAFVDQSPQGIFYCKSWWMDAVAPGCHKFLTVGEEKHIQAGWPIAWSADGNDRKIVMPPLTQKLGVLFASTEAKYVEGLAPQHRLMDQLISKLPPDTTINQGFQRIARSMAPPHRSSG